MNIVIFKAVSLFCRNNRRFLNICLAPIAFGVLAGCLDIPEAVDDSGKIVKVEVLVKQFGETSMEPLKLNSSEKAELIVDIAPDKEKDKVKYYWYIDEDLIDSGRTYAISTSFMSSEFFRANFIPNRLVVEDREGSTLEKKFTVTVNTPPWLSNITTPADGDTLYGNSQTPFSFAWLSIDNDEGDHLQNILEIDGTRYQVGELNQVFQSGFSEGSHTFRILVEDSQGDKDSLPMQEFFVIDTLEGK